MSNFPQINDIVRIGKGKVEYVVVNVTDLNELGTGAVTVESKNTGKVQVVEQARITIVRSAELERTQVIAESTPAKVTVPEFYNRPEDTFDPREDRRQSAYGLAILAALMRKGASNPRQFSHNSNALKPIGSKRTKVRKSVKARRTRVNALSAQYNALLRENGYTINAA